MRVRVGLPRSSPHSSYENVAELLREARAGDRAPVQRHVPGADEPVAGETRPARPTRATSTRRTGRD